MKNVIIQDYGRVLGLTSERLVIREHDEENLHRLTQQTSL